ncbi:hypothetical protein AMATHDRAFT_69268 [Amanita thiersii Skay4041]|uniref:Cytochrome P450 n=1 Tax=Amanita thiersii Skay4041 TaxID=703135 RepID=A0A2A9NEL5_9AGAR|nr:hypothetical protein AMATHDRAFT_69268 [Amanita thiersii Skay4041]
MESLQGSFYWVVLIPVSVALAVRLLSSKRLPLPPGPRGLPILGNVLDLPASFEWLHWAKYQKLYGPISCVQALGKTIIILNTIEVCKELLDKRSSKYSDRPTLTLAGEMIGWNQQMILAPYGKRFRSIRRMVHGYVGTKAAAVSLAAVQEIETRYFLARILRNPKRLMEEIRLTEGAIFIQISHGYIINKEKRDPLVSIVEKAAQEFYIATAPGKWLVDTFPILRHVPAWMPGAKFKRMAEEFRKTNMDQLYIPHEFVLKQIESKTAQKSFTTTMLQSDLSPEESELIKFASNSLYAGGTDTVTATIAVFFLAMVLYPEVQKRAQREIDEVVGGHRLPCMADRDQLPYLAAVQKEVMRWQSIGPMGIPHYTSEEDEYNGYYIPKGSIVVANIWNIGHDEDNFKDPMTFNPDRYLEQDGHVPERDPHEFVFGFGRRVCPGQGMADANVFIAMAMSLSVFHIEKARDENGVEIVPKIEYMTGTVCHIKPFDFTLSLRTPDSDYLIQSVFTEHPPLEPSQL